MASPIEQLQAGGFSEEEVATWAQERRGVLTEAGFKENEIDAYFTGGVTAPEKVPASFMERINVGQAISRVAGKTAESASEGWGDPTPTGMSNETLDQFIKLGIFHDPQKGGPGPIQFANEAVILPVAKTIDVLLRGLNAGVHGAGGLVGGVMEELGASQGMANRAKNETINFANWAMIEAGNGSFTRTRVTPQGVVDEVIGGPAKSEDFLNAARSVGDDAKPVQEKLLRSYEQQGRHPAEVAFDAQADAVVHQRLLSKDPLDMPYGGAATQGDEIVGYHWSPRAFDVYSKDAAPWMEGAGPDAVGYMGDGVYLAATPENAGLYRDLAKASGKVDGEGHLYAVKVTAEPAHIVDLDKPFSEQSPFIQEALRPLLDAQEDFNKAFKIKNAPKSEEQLVSVLADAYISMNDLSQGLTPGFHQIVPWFKERGVAGVRHTANVDADGTFAGKTSKGDLVIFDPKDVTFTARDGTDIGGLPPRPPSGQPPKPPEPGSFGDAQQKILDKISVGGKDAVRPWTLDRLYTELIDDLHPLKDVSRDAYQMARLTRGQFGKAEHFLEYGTFEFNTYKTTGKPLKAILEPVREDLNGLRAYLASKRAVDLEGSGRKSGMDVEAARRVVAEGEGQYGKIAGELVEYQNRLLTYLKDSGVVSEKAFDAMVEANQNYVPFFRVFALDKGGPGSRGFGPGNPIKKLKGSERDIYDPLESIIKNTYAYVSIAERNQVGVTLIDALKKEGLKVESKRAAPLDADLATYLKEQGISDPANLSEFIAREAADDGTTLSAWRNGVREEVKVNDHELVAAFRGMDRQSASLLTKVFSVPAQTLRTGAVLTPDFMARNLIRDFMTAFVNTSKGVFSPIDTAKGLVSAIRKDADFQNWLKAGGANSTMVALDRAYLQESLTKLAGETGLMDRAWNVVKNPIGEGLKPLRMLSELAENATRLGEFKRAAAGATGKDALQSAAFASREVTLDFARMGAKMRAYNMLTAFANAQIQGMDRILRAFKDKPVETTAKVAGGITLPSVLLWWANHDDQRYKDLPNWQKDLFWIILTDKWEPIDPATAATKPAHLVRERGGKTEFNNGSIWRIPKPFELGVVFGSGVERALEATVGQSEGAFDGFTKSVTEILTPTYMPTAFVPLFEQYANRSHFSDRTLIPADVEKHLPEYQYAPYTTQLSRKLGQVVAAFPGMREASITPGSPAGPVARSLTTPILIENYIRGWTGGMGVYALQAADAALRKAGQLPDPIGPTPTLADIPFVKAFAVRYPSAGAQPIQDFYDGQEKAKRFYDTWMARAKDGDTAAMARIEAAGGQEMFARLDEIKNTMTDHSKLVRDIYKNPEIPAEEKRQLIDGLYYAMIQLARTGREMQRSIKAGEPMPLP